VPLTILDDGVDYIAEIWRDGKDAHWDDNPYALDIERRRLDSESVLELQLAAGGGAAVWIRRYEEATEE